MIQILLQIIALFFRVAVEAAVAAVAALAAQPSRVILTRALIR